MEGRSVENDFEGLLNGREQLNKWVHTHTHTHKHTQIETERERERDVANLTMGT